MRRATDVSYSTVSVIRKWSNMRKTPPASRMLTLVRLLASVSPGVNCQGAALYKALLAVWNCTRVRTLICMDFVVALKICVAFEALKELFSRDEKREWLVINNMPCCTSPSRTEKDEQRTHAQEIQLVPLVPL